VPDDLDLVASPSAEDEDVSAIRVAFEDFLNMQAKAIHTSTHVGMT
jgi:hypothetical protein